MLNEDKIKEQYQLALLDTKEEKSIETHRLFYRSDYISKELLKSFFSGTFAFIALAVLILLGHSKTLMDTINTVDYDALASQLIVVYLAFIIIYFIITYVIYAIRYEKQKNTVKTYRSHLKKLNKLYRETGDDKSDEERE